MTRNAKGYWKGCLTLTTTSWQQLMKRVASDSEDSGQQREQKLRGTHDIGRTVHPLKMNPS